MSSCALATCAGSPLMVQMEVSESMSSVAPDSSWRRRTFSPPLPMTAARSLPSSTTVESLDELRMSSTMLLACCTAAYSPEMTHTSLLRSRSRRAPVSLEIFWMVAPPGPKTSVRLAPRSTVTRSLLPMMSEMRPCALRTCSRVPVILHCSVPRSTSTLAPLCSWILEICSPFLPMTSPLKAPMPTTIVVIPELSTSRLAASVVAFFFLLRLGMVVHPSSSRAGSSKETPLGGARTVVFSSCSAWVTAGAGAAGLLSAAAFFLFFFLFLLLLVV
mmetsp:Transcript_9909/g.28019  ORF Transcript_9909/g.28019 Transcript_9909/m.28019 type:complete len:274 (-) Transcript_9909:122-943(-)